LKEGIKMEKNQMRMARFTEPYVIRFETSEIPVPKKGQVLLKVLRCGICGSDPTTFKGMHPFCPPPVVMGHEFSRIIAELGEGITDLSVGDRVTVFPHLTCGECDRCRENRSNLCETVKCIGGQADGAHCEYIALDRHMIFPIADTMSFESAAMVEPAAVGYHGAVRANITQDDYALVFGAGTIGIFAMQACKARGAKRVFITDVDVERLELALSLGADGIINQSKESLEEGLTRLCGDTHRIDKFFECVGGKGAVLDQIISIARRGTTIVMIGIQNEGCHVEKLPYLGEHELSLLGSNMYDAQDYKEVIDFMGRNEIRTEGMITHTFKFDDLMEAFDLAVNKKEKFMKIMLEMD